MRYLKRLTGVGGSTELVAQDSRGSALAALQSPTSPLLANLRQVDVAAMGFKFGFQLETLGKEGGATLA